MKKPEKILRPIKRIHGGTHVPHNKNTAEFEREPFFDVDHVAILMQQHIGAPCIPCVKPGDSVFVGTKIGDSDKYISAPIHSSVSGTVSKIDTVLLPSGQTSQQIVIKSDSSMTPDPEIKPVEVKTADDLIAAARNSGLVGLGGAGFPAHVKLKTSPEKPIDYLIINAAECEPFITADYRECMENPDDILEGVYLIKTLLNIKNVIICVEDNKPKAIKTLYNIACDRKDTDNSVRLMRLKSSYPQGAEKVLIYSATGRKVPFGKLPSDVGCIVMNVTSIAFLNRYIKTGMPLVSKSITVDGGGINNPKNLTVPIGTPFEEIFEYCGGLKPDAVKFLSGGPMMGVSVADTSMSVLKQTNAITVLSKNETALDTPYSCINCGRCASACPMNLTPARVDSAMQFGKQEELIKLHPEYCIECGCCSYSCPSKRHLTQTMRLAKTELKKSK